MPGLLGWLRSSMGGSRGSMSAALSGLDAFVNPAAARAREDLREQHERVMPTPSPGDRLLDEGRLVLRRSDPAADSVDPTGVEEEAEEGDATGAGQD